MNFVSDPSSLYCNKEEWKDIKGVPQDEGPAPICAIAYPYEFIDCMDYFRAIVRADERSERALHLTADVIERNPANYVAWQFRRLCLYALQSDLHVELEEFVHKLSRDNPKNYQMWHHRRACTEQLAKGASAAENAVLIEREKKFCHKLILLDTKNLHAWGHRQWVVSHFGSWDNELEFVDELLLSDIRNNSAWNHRYFVATQSAEPSLAREQADYAWSAILKAPNNESPWSFLRGILLWPASKTLGFVENDSNEALLADIEKRAIELEQRLPACAHCTALQVEIAQHQLDQVDNATDKQKAAELREKCVKLCNVLIERRDTLHANYWRFRMQSFSNE